MAQPWNCNNQCCRIPKSNAPGTLYGGFQTHLSPGTLLPECRHLGSGSCPLEGASRQKRLWGKALRRPCNVSLHVTPGTEKASYKHVNVSPQKFQLFVSAWTQEPQGPESPTSTSSHRLVQQLGDSRLNLMVTLLPSPVAFLSSKSLGMSCPGIAYGHTQRNPITRTSTLWLYGSWQRSSFRVRQMITGLQLPRILELQMA